MSNYIPDEIIDEIRSSNDIVDVISGYVRLKKQGRNFVGLCPFHNEKTPSFMVSPDKQIFRCFGCGEGGNVISFVMKREHITFPEAAKLLAQRTGISVPEQEDPVLAAKVRETENLFEINGLARDFFHYVLCNHEIAGDARKYLSSRGITSETIEKFQIGYASPLWDALLNYMNKKGYSADRLEKLGLVLPRSRGPSGFYDRFRNRIMFPIWDLRGKVVGFGGRVLDDSLPKYLNSPETPLFNKSHQLYGLNKAAESIRQKDQVIVVEGYMDVISCHQAGINNVVASLGTAFTREQGKLLMRYTREVVIAYDADIAGVNATIKGWQVLDDIGCRVRVASIPEGKDPDEFIKNRGSDQFIEIINNNALSLCDYKTDRAMEKYDIYTLEGKFKIASEVIPSIKNLSNEIEKDEAIMKLAKRLHLSPEAIRAEVEKTARSPRNIWGNRDKITGLRDNKSDSVCVKTNDTKDARAKAEETLLVLMLQSQDVFIRVKDKLGIHFTERQEYLNIINLLNEIIEKELNYQPAELFDRLDGHKESELLSFLLMKELPGDNREKIILDCLRTIEEDQTRKKRENLLRQMEDADKNRDHELRQKLLLEYTKLI